MEIVIRRCVLSDSDSLYTLNSNEMGYFYPAEQTTNQLSTILNDSTNAVFVAVNGGEVIGYIHGAVYNVLYADPMVNVLGIAVCERYRRMGVGRALLDALENWALENGISSMRLTSGAERTSAHEFYIKCGYVLKKSQLNFKKNI